MGVALDKVVSFEISDDAIVERMSGRRVCESCGKTFHIKHLPSAKGDVCDACDGKLVIRADDDPAVVRSRLEVYHSTTEPLKDYYREKGMLCTVEAIDGVEETTKRTFEALGI